MVKFNLNKFMKLIGISILTILICNIIFSLIYSFSFLIPKDDLIKSLRQAQSTSVLKTPMNSIERSTTGWGIDYGTECVALSIGLKDKIEYSGIDKIKSRFYDSYLVSGQNKGVFDPCAGLIQLISSSNSSMQDNELLSYARNWWGMSVIIQGLVWLVGLATAKSFLYIGMILSIGLFYYKFTKATRDFRIGLLFLFPFILFADFQELHNSFPYAIFTIELFIIAYLTLNFIALDRYDVLKFFVFSISVGAIYNFIFWFNFHLVLMFIPAVIFLLQYRNESLSSIRAKIFVFISGFGFGFILTTIVKWVLSVAIYGSEILVTIKDALGLRLGTSTSGINQPLSQYSSGVAFLPLSLRAIVVNLMVAASKYVDPRNSSLVGVIVFIGFYLAILLLFLWKMNPVKNISATEFTYASSVFLIPFVYYILTPNHSFNHAAVSYRALPVAFGFLLSVIYLSKNRSRRLVRS
jgi:hypothetical protein